MTITITAAYSRDKVVYIEGTDTSEEQLIRLERGREDRDPKIITYCIDSTTPRHCRYISKWLKRQKATQGAKTYGEAVRAVVGTVTQSPRSMYRVWE